MRLFHVAFFGSGQVEKCPPPDLLSLFLGTLPPSKVFGRGGGRVKSAQETETQEERRRGEGDKCAIVTGNFSSFLLVLSSARLTLFLSSHPPLGGKYTISPFLLLKEGQGGPAVHLLCPFSSREPPTAVTATAPSQKAVHFRRVMPVWEKCTGSSSITPADGRLAMPRPAERNC